MKDKLLIFDMDGTLFDTSESNYLAYKEAAESLGYEIDRDKFMRLFVGKNYREFLPLFGICEDDELQQVHDLKKEFYKKYLNKIQLNNELFTLIKSSKETCIIALATTASKKNSFDILDFFNVTDLFDIILTQDDVKALKPDPDCYNKVMETAGMTAENTTIYEDSEVGIMAARASGAKVVKI